MNHQIITFNCYRNFYKYSSTAFNDITSGTVYLVYYFYFYGIGISIYVRSI